MAFSKTSSFSTSSFSPIALSAHDLAVHRSGRAVVAGFSAHVAAGHGLALRGPNGAGKSTLIAALAGLLPLEAGTLAWKGLDPETPPREAMHMLGHLSGIKPALTVHENLRFAARVLGGDRAAIEDALARAGLAALAQIEAGLLSAGQGRRLALARFLIAERAVWLLDEPTAALDAQGAEWVSAMIADHLDAGGTVVFATHLDLPIEADPRVTTHNLAALEAPA